MITMNQPQAFGTFLLTEKNTFRTSAFIQWGDSKKSLGSCLLLNPGSAHLNKNIPDTELSTMNEIPQRIQTDPTMKQVIKLVQCIYHSEDVIEGRLHIFNLFNLQDATSVSAIEKFENLVNNKEYNVNCHLTSIEDLRTHPWILLGWSLQRNTRWVNLEEAKRLWRVRIAESGIPVFGKQDPVSRNYYHPNPHLHSKKTEILKELTILHSEMH